RHRGHHATGSRFATGGQPAGGPRTATRRGADLLGPVASRRGRPARGGGHVAWAAVRARPAAQPAVDGGGRGAGSGRSCAPGAVVAAWHPRRRGFRRLAAHWLSIRPARRIPTCWIPARRVFARRVPAWW